MARARCARPDRAPVVLPVRDAVLAARPAPRDQGHGLRGGARGPGRLGRGARAGAGGVGAVELEDRGGSIVPHERTMPGPIEDRLRLMRAVRTNLSSIHAVFRGPREPFAGFLDGATAQGPAASTTDAAGG